ncbi:MAG: ATP-binding cassette domain-containing protein [Saprospiraceae bacterium]|nr:ATP-binding cassette domain-containing protein [Saprospiraceae bacterium]
MPKINIKKYLSGPSEDFRIDIKLEFQKESVIALYGPSGSGKTSILRMIAGLLKPDSGSIVYDGKVWFDGEERINTSIQSREIAMVFQGTSLFPHMSVLQNLNYAAQGKWKKVELLNIANNFQLSDHLTKNIRVLSGGQKQKVELARAILRRPKLMLLDEPFNALDIENKSILKKVLADQIIQYGITTILVSHDMGEVIALTDKIYVLDEGKIIKQGNPLTVFSEKTALTNFQISGEIVNIRHDEILNIVSILVGKQVVKVAAHHSEIQNMKVGDMVSMSSKAFNPILTRLK